MEKGGKEPQMNAQPEKQSLVTQAQYAGCRATRNDGWDGRPRS